jgi:hypothetical protein
MLAMNTPGAALLASVLALSGCQRDPGRDVKPMTTAIRTDGKNDSAIVPLDKVAKSQPAIVGQRIANTELMITYSRPVARGRVLFGGIVPYDQVWNPGADQATAIAITRDVQINAHPLPAGKYSLWMIPRAADWTVIFSKAADVYHTPYPGEGQDALRFDVRPETGPPAETLTFEFPVVEGKDAELEFRWGTVAVPLKIQVP